MWEKIILDADTYPRIPEYLIHRLQLTPHEMYEMGLYLRSNPARVRLDPVFEDDISRLSGEGALSLTKRDIMNRAAEVVYNDPTLSTRVDGMEVAIFRIARDDVESGRLKVAVRLLKSLHKKMQAVVKFRRAKGKEVSMVWTLLCVRSIIVEIKTRVPLIDRCYAVEGILYDLYESLSNWGEELIRAGVLETMYAFGVPTPEDVARLEKIVADYYYRSETQAIYLENFIRGCADSIYYYQDLRVSAAATIDELSEGITWWDIEIPPHPHEIPVVG